MKFIKIIWIGK